MSFFKPLDDATFDRIRLAFLERLVLLLSDRHWMTVKHHSAFSRRFRTLKSGLMTETARDGHPEIPVLSNMKWYGKHVGTLRRGSFRYIDLCFERLPSAAGILHAGIVLDGDGLDIGDTLFSNLVAVYGALPQDISE